MESHIHILNKAFGYLTKELSLEKVIYGHLHLHFICLTFHTQKHLYYLNAHLNGQTSFNKTWKSP